MRLFRWELILAALLLLVLAVTCVWTVENLSRPATADLMDTTQAALGLVVCCAAAVSWLIGRAFLPRAKWDLTIALPFVLLQLSTWMGLGKYLAGRLCGEYYGRGMCFTLFVTLAVSALWCGYLAITTRQRAKVSTFQDVGRVMTIVVMVFAIPAALGCPAPGGNPFLRGFKQWLTEQGPDIPSIRAWGSSLKGSEKENTFIEADCWPESVKALNPRYVIFSGPEHRVELQWRPFFDLRLGLAVGPEVMPIPGDEDNRIKLGYARAVHARLCAWPIE